MSGDVNQDVGHKQENKVNTNSHTFENCKIENFAIHIHSGSGQEEQEITFSSKQIGDNAANQIFQLPNDPDTIIKVLTHCQENGINSLLSLPDSITLPAIENNSNSSDDKPNNF